MALKKKVWLKGSYTVEASIAVPLLLALVLFSILAAFFLHDRAVLQAETIGKGFGEGLESSTLFLAEPAQFSEEQGFWDSRWTGTAHYRGISVPLLRIFRQDGAMEVQWESGKAAMPDFLRLWSIVKQLGEEEI